MDGIKEHIQFEEVANKRVLLVEDNTINIKVISLLLRECDIKSITVARNGKEALRIFSPEFDLVILDIGLPDMSGIAVCHEMRRILENKSMPIIACTAETTIEQICREEGFSDFMMKPITLEVTQGMIQRWLK